MYTIKLKLFYTVLKLILQKNHTLEETTNCTDFGRITTSKNRYIHAKSFQGNLVNHPSYPSKSLIRRALLAKVAKQSAIHRKYLITVLL